MCGISCTVNGSLQEVSRIGHTIKHRGIHHDVTEIDNIKVFFSWLPIVSNKAPQPFTVGKWTVWLNGYISNYKELAEKYNITLWVDSDTLLLTEFIAKFNLQRLNELNGFFGVVAYDSEDIHTFTDRYGIKQLYEYREGDKRYICSEVKGLLSIIPNIELDPEAVEDWEYSLGVMTDDTIYKGIKRIKSLPFSIDKPKSYIYYDEAQDELIRLLKQSFDRNRTSVKTGVLLSGGIDSGIIAKWGKPDYSFSMDYLNDLSEIDNIKLNSSGTHYTMICNDDLRDRYAKQTVKTIDDLKVGSCYTNFAITELASKFCTVLYSGAGGDELFYGYTHRYNKNIDDVICRNNKPTKHYDITHEEYDWRFLRGILTIEDRIGGHHTLETRYPFLDNDLVDFVLTLPLEFRYNKKILKEVSGLHKDVVSGKKRGFSNPHFSTPEWTNFALNETISLYNPV